MSNRDTGGIEKKENNDFFDKTECLRDSSPKMCSASPHWGRRKATYRAQCGFKTSSGPLVRDIVATCARLQYFKRVNSPMDQPVNTFTCPICSKGVVRSK